MFANKIPERYRHSVIPHVMVDGAAEAIKFYIRAFGVTEIFRIALTDGKVIHAEIRIGESVVMVGDADGPFRSAKSLGGSSVGLHVYMPNVDAMFAQAIAAGATEVQPPSDRFYGDRSAMIADPFGHVWVLLTHLESLTPEQIVGRAETLLNP